jgi:hypothetical protein
MQRHLKPVPQVVILSVEEEAIAADEISGNRIDTEKESADIDRLGDIVITMGDAQVVVSNTPEVSTIDKELVFAVGDMAVAGTDSSADNIVGQVLLDQSTSTEGFVSSVKEGLVKMWEAIKAFFVKMWNNVKEFSIRMAKKLGLMEDKVEKVDKIYEDLSEYGIKNDADMEQFLKELDISVKDTLSGSSHTSASPKNDTSKKPHVDPPKQTDSFTPIAPFHFTGCMAHLCVGDGKQPIAPAQLAAKLNELHIYAITTSDQLRLTAEKLLEELIHIAEEGARDPSELRELIRKHQPKYDAINKHLTSRIGPSQTKFFLGDLYIKAHPHEHMKDSDAFLASPTFEISFKHYSHNSLNKLPLVNGKEAEAITAEASDWVKKTKNAWMESESEKIHALSLRLEKAIDHLMTLKPKPEDMGMDVDFQDLQGSARKISNSVIDTSIKSLAMEAKAAIRMGAWIAPELVARADEVFATVLDYCKQSGEYALRNVKGPLKTTKDVDDYFTQ